MLKKLLLIPAVAIFMFVGVVAHAQTDVLPDAGMLPGNPFYFLKSTSEGIGTFFSFGKVAKAERYAHLADKRLAEAEELADGGDSERAEKATEKYQERMDRALARAEEAKAEGKDVDEVLARVAEATLKHQETLARVYEQVPEKAREAIKNAMERSARGHDEALKAVSGEKREEIEDRIEERKQEREARFKELRAKGVPVPELKDRMERKEEIKTEDHERELIREEEKQRAEIRQQDLEKKLENSDLTERERESLKQAGERIREEEKQMAEKRPLEGSNLTEKEREIIKQKVERSREEVKQNAEREGR